MKVLDMCLLEKENREFGVGFHQKKGVQVWDHKNRAFVCVNFPKQGVIRCKIESNFSENLPILAVNQQNFKMRTKILKFYVVKKGGHWVWTVVKNRVFGCKICIKRGLLTGRCHLLTYGSATHPPGLKHLRTVDKYIFRVVKGF